MRTAKKQQGAMRPVSREISDLNQYNETAARQAFTALFTRARFLLSRYFKC